MYYQLSYLNVSQNTVLLTSCYNNQLTSLDVRNGNNLTITDFQAIANSYT